VAVAVAQAVGLLATVVLAAAQTALHLQQIPLLQQQILAVAVAVVDLVARLNRKDRQAAPASSSSSTHWVLLRS
jgi:ribonuclease PH